MTRRNPSRRRDNDEPTLRLREPIDVLGAIPYLVGYHPDDSLVVIAMRRKQLHFTSRVDLVAPEHAPDLAHGLLRVILGQAVTGVIIVGYGADERVRPAAVSLKAACERAGVDVMEVLRAHDRRYWSYLCGDPVCCPADGIPFDPETSATAARATMSGRVVLPDREAYERQVRPVGGLSRLAMTQAADRADERLFALLAHATEKADALLAAGDEAVSAALDAQRQGVRLDDDEVAWLAALVEAIPVRDLAWVRITGSSDELDVHRSLWMDVMRRCDPDMVAAPASLFAFAAWRQGDSALARLALERVLKDDPTYSMARLIDDALARGVPPSTLGGWPPRRRGGPTRSVSRRSGPRPRRRSSSRRAGSRRG